MCTNDPIYITDTRVSYLRLDGMINDSLCIHTARLFITIVSLFLFFFKHLYKPTRNSLFTLSVSQYQFLTVEQCTIIIISYVK